MSTTNSSTNGNAKRSWTREMLIEYITQTTGQSNLITTPKIFIRMCDKDHMVATVLSQIVYWQDKGSGPRAEEGWFYKKAEEWDEEIGVSDYQLTRAVKKLERFGVQTKVMKVGTAPTRHFKLDWTMFLKAISEFLGNQETMDGAGNASFSQREIQETPNSSNTPPTDTHTPTGGNDHYTPGEFVADLAMALKDADVPLMKGKKGQYGKDLKELQEARPDIQPKTWRLVRDWIITRWLDDNHFKLGVEAALGDVMSGRAKMANRRAPAGNVVPIDRGGAGAARRSKDFDDVFAKEMEEQEREDKTRDYLQAEYERGGPEELERAKMLAVKAGADEEDVDAMADEILMGDAADG